MNKEKITTIVEKLESRLLNARNSEGFWECYLSSSAVSTAVATFALWKYDKVKYKNQIIAGINWLEVNINEDGGWGDTSDSPTNLSATLLAWSALSIVKDENKYQSTINKCESWLKSQIGELKPDAIVQKVISFYGDDKTFSVPILMFCTLAGRLGKEPDCWKRIQQLPFEFAVFPHNFYKFLNLNVVSYALPALIGIGLVKHRKTPSDFLITKYIRESSVSKVIKILEKLQPTNGGFLEAPPLTGFVAMSLCETEFKEHIVVHRAIDFLVKRQRSDGSWPIDSNLATWGTTLSIKALLTENCHAEVLEADSSNENANLRKSPFDPDVSGRATNSILTDNEKQNLKNWLLNQQFQQEHHFTHSEPGGWGWTNLVGAAPDADDTSGALLALHKLYKGEPEILIAVEKGIKWLINLQNSDGGIPTFCRGWGKLPFDKSCGDLTAHAIRAMFAWKTHLPHLLPQIKKAITKMIRYLKKHQHSEGYWLPLWFGNQNYTNHENPIYGTSLVMIALQEIEDEFPQVEKLIGKAYYWLKLHQNEDGGWGMTREGWSSIEETSLALTALAGFGLSDEIEKATQCLIKMVDIEDELPANPIGLYFASLWYWDKIYPMVYSLTALKKIKLSFIKD